LFAESLFLLGLGFWDPCCADAGPVHDLADPLPGNAKLLPRAPKMAQFLIPLDDLVRIGLPVPWERSGSIDHRLVLLSLP
jgi:hypothetical protein